LILEEVLKCKDGKDDIGLFLLTGNDLKLKNQFTAGEKNTGLTYERKRGLAIEQLFGKPKEEMLIEELLR